jgi:hypothetical protein
MLGDPFYWGCRNELFRSSVVVVSAAADGDTAPCFRGLSRKMIVSRLVRREWIYSVKVEGQIVLICETARKVFVLYI